MNGPGWRFAAGIAIALAALGAEAKSLHWRALDVEARLESSGELRVRERHTMVFDGDWNGGERHFRLEPGQEIANLTIARVDATGQEWPLREGRGGSIPLHHVAWISSDTIRWRNRNPGDPPFDDEVLVYVIDYSLRNVVAPAGNGFLLDHDFAFSDRPGAIRSFSLRLEVDPVWIPEGGIPEVIRRVNLAPGESVTVRRRIAWSGEGAPRFVSTGPRAANRAAADPIHRPSLDSASLVEAVVPFAAVMALAIVWFFARETRDGRFARQPVVTRAWLNENIFVHRPEVVGAAWDRRTGQAEVAALIAVMTAEGKIENVADASGPRMRLLVPREGLSEYERAFVDRLFVSGDEIDTTTLRRHYAATGFDPAAAIRNPLRRAAGQLIGTHHAAPVVAGCMITLLSIPLLIFAADADSALERIIFLGPPILLASLGLATVYRTELRGRLFAATLPVPLLLYAWAAAVHADQLRGLIVLLAFAGVGVFLTLAAGRWQGTPEQLRTLVQFRLARRFLAERLQRGGDGIEETWVPYLFAFGLGRDLDRWLVAAPAAPAGKRAEFDAARARIGRSSSPSSASAFAGGGGAFGGAGASGTWAASIDSFAASISPPRSSGSGSGGGSRSSSRSSGSRSSSGGGGGGGW